MVNEDTAEGLLAGILSEGLLVLIGKIVAMGLGFLTQIVMGRYLGAESYGAVVLALAVLNFSVLVSTLGLDQGVLRKIPEKKNEPKTVWGLTMFSIKLSLLTGLSLSVIIFAAAPLISDLIASGNELTLFLRLVTLAIPFAATGKIAVGIARSLDNARVHIYVDQIFRPSLRLGLLLIFVVAGYNSTAILSSNIIAFILPGLVAISLLWGLTETSNAYKWNSITGTDKQLQYGLLLFSLPLLVSQGLGLINNIIDTFVIGYFLDSQSVGIYNSAFKLRSVLKIVVASLGFLLPSALATLSVQDNVSRMNTIYTTITKWSIFLTFPIFLFIIFSPATILDLTFGEEYITAATTLQVLATGRMISTSLGLNGISLVGLGENQSVLYTSVLTVGINVILNIILIPIFGIVGAAMAVSIASVIGNSIRAFILYYKYSIYPFSKELLLPLVTVSFSAILGYLLLLTGLISFLVIGIIWLVVYPILLFFTDGINKSDWKLLVSLRNTDN